MVETDGYSAASVSALFSQSDAGLPPWFKPERFLEPDFDSEAYVADLRRSVPLDTLSTELESHLTTLKAKLVEVINEDYDDFVNLSSKLVSVDGAVLRMQKPLLEIKEKLEGVRGSLQGELAELGEGLARRQQVTAARSLLELMQDTAHVASKVEKLLAEIDAEEGGGAGPGPLDDRTRLYERVASEVSRLNFYAARGAELPFMQQMEPRMRAAKEKLQGLLEEGLQASLSARIGPATQHCLHAFAAIGEPSGAEQVVRQLLVRPLVRRVLDERRRAQPRAGGGSDSLAEPLEAIAAAIKKELGDLLELVLAPQSGLHAIHLLPNSVLAEVDEALKDHMPGAFSAGVPATFLPNYRAAMAFLERLEGYCHTAAAVQALRRSAAADSYLRRWQLSVYFSLRFQSIAEGLETAISLPSLAAAPPPTATSALGSLLTSSPSAPPLRLAASSALAAGLLRCLGPDVLLRPISDKFLKLAMQMCARYAAWLAAGVGARREGAAAVAGGGAAGPGGFPGQGTAVAGGGAGVAGGPPGQGTLMAGSGAAGGGASGQAAGPAEEAPGHWAVRAQPEELCLVRADLDSLQEWLTGAYLGYVAAALEPLPPNVRDAVSSALGESARALHTQSGPILGFVADALVDKCQGVLKQLRGITATYRMTTRPPPERPSHYVAGVLAPLQGFLAAPAASSLREESSRELVQAVVEGVCSLFQRMATDLLDTLRKTESSLRRLKKTRAGEDEGQLSDIDKISMQLALDVKEFGRQVGKFGLDPASLGAFQELLHTVVPAEQAGSLLA